MNTVTGQKYRFINDPGHGWLEVPTAELDTLGIADDISGYSYRSKLGTCVYLEEDCDLSLFLRAKLGSTTTAAQLSYWFDANVQDEYSDPCFVRDLPAYKYPTRGNDNGYHHHN